jgi:uncharacterized protein (DUF1697 family)
MKDLAALYESNGFSDIQTYVQSGNVVFSSSEKNPVKISRIIEKKIEQKYKFHADVLVRSVHNVKKVIDENPFLKKPGVDPAFLYVTFLSQAPDAQSTPNLSNVTSGADQFEIRGAEIFLWCPDGYGRTKLSNNFFETKLRRVATTRNWNTVMALFEMSVNPS